jgi:K+-transporting ATPase c subunit
MAMRQLPKVPVKKPLPKKVVKQNVKQVTNSPNHFKMHAKEALYIGSAILGLAVTVDAYFYSGKHISYQRHQQLEIVQELNKTDKKILELIKEIDAKVDSNSKSIEILEDNLKHIGAQRPLEPVFPSYELTI